MNMNIEPMPRTMCTGYKDISLSFLSYLLYRPFPMLDLSSHVVCLIHKYAKSHKHEFSILKDCSLFIYKIYCEGYTRFPS